MPISVPNPYTGKPDETCSVSFAAQQSVAGGVSGQQTEAQYNRSKLAGEWGVIKAKALNGEIPFNTKVLTFESQKFGKKGYIVLKGNGLKVVSFDLKNKRSEEPLSHPADVDYWIKSDKYKVAIPQAVSPKPKPEPVELTGNEIFDIDQKFPETIPNGKVFAVNSAGDYVSYNKDDALYPWTLYTDDHNTGHKAVAVNASSFQDIVSPGDGWLKPDNQASTPNATPKTVTPPAPKPVVAQVTNGQLHTLNAQADVGNLPNNTKVIEHDNGSYVTYNAHSQVFELHSPDSGKVFFQDKDITDLIDDPKGWHLPGAEASAPIAAPTPSTPVNSGSPSVGSMSDEDVAAMFVSIKDKLTKELGVNVKGSNPDLDAVVHKSIGGKTGYTAAEVKAKIDAYKAAGNKLSALKKKVLLGTKKVPDPQPNKVPTKATATIVNEVKEAVTVKVEANPTKHYADEDIAAAYIIAKDQIVAASSGKFTLYTKSDELDSFIAFAVKTKTGFTKEQQQQAIANYLGSGKKLSTLKKQLAKQGAFTPQAATLKKSGADKDLASKAHEVEEKAAAGYTPTPTPSSAGSTSAPIATGKPAPVRVKKEAAERGKIDNIPQATKTNIYSIFKSTSSKSYLSSTSGQNYDGFVDVQVAMQADGKDYTLLQIMRVVDEEGAKKFSVANTNVFETKVATFLTTPEGEQHVKDAEKAKAAKIEKAKKAAEAIKAAKELEANQPPLPADSAQFQDVTLREATALDKQWTANNPRTPAQIHGLRHYTGGDYIEMNGFLRGKHHTITPTSKKAIEDAAAGMRPSTQPMLFKRGTGRSQFALGSIEEIWAITGKTFQDKGFLSTSAGGRAAFGGEIRMEVEAPTGTLMAYVDPFSKNSGENEMLLQKGLYYKVLNVRKEGNTYVVRLRVVEKP